MHVAGKQTPVCDRSQGTCRTGQHIGRHLNTGTPAYVSEAFVFDCSFVYVYADQTFGSYCCWSFACVAGKQTSDSNCGFGYPQSCVAGWQALVFDRSFTCVYIS